METENKIMSIHSTRCEHEYYLDPEQDPNTNLTSVRCSKCWHGIMIDAEKFEIKNGKVEKK